MADETIYAIRRTDGEPIYGLLSFVVVDGPDDWTGAEEDTDGTHDPVEYELLRMTVEPVARRTLPNCRVAAGLPDGEQSDG